ncbi:MFS transporter [Saccharothrix violaceirubra]|uniref:MFS family permease n=1 Tax=Saccharothrix violaceirubra TaxID=413306 RepID=A0A7W7SZF2_9PSEU|nr:MFS transporter [Saccharothrix violaceirubra]MBB4963685.1 MFS family permease [Saccharothrix violaceirubra]
MKTTSTPSRLWSPERRGPTAGIVLLVTLLAFENMGVNTAMPRMVASLDGNDLYAWPFLAFLAASVVATVLSGRLSDVRGPRPSLILGPAVFLVGLLVAGTAQDMGMLLLGRVLQGLGGGAQVVAAYVLIGLVYPESDRPAVFGVLSSAWVVPSLVGPALSGWLTETVGWRWVFLGLAPFVLVAVLLITPVLRGLPAHTPDQGTRRGLPLAALAAGVGVSALSWAAQHPNGLNLVAGLAGLAILVPALRVLLPKGTLSARRGLPFTILARGLLAGSFFGAEAFLPLTLTSVHGYSAVAAGLPLTISALGWSGASLWQARRPDIPREKLVRAGFVLNAVGIAGVTLVAPSWGPAWATPVLWLVAGAGMGMAMSSLSVLTLGASTDADRGFNSSALQMSDMLTAALLVGLGGVMIDLIASAEHPTAAVVPFDLAMVAVSLVGAVLAGRLRRATLDD